MQFLSFPQFIVLKVISPFTYGKQLHVRQMEMSRLTGISIAMVHAFHSLQPLCVVRNLSSISLFEEMGIHMRDQLPTHYLQQNRAVLHSGVRGRLRRKTGVGMFGVGSDKVNG